MKMKKILNLKWLWMTAYCTAFALPAIAQNTAGEARITTTVTLSTNTQGKGITSTPAAKVMSNAPLTSATIQASVGNASEVKPAIASVVADADASSETLQSDGNTSSSENAIRLNFRGVPLNSVLDYLSKAGGFTVIRNTEVSGNI